MRLLLYLPGSSQLNPRAFVKPTASQRAKLSLSTSHRVQGKFGPKDVEGAGKVRYVVERVRDEIGLGAGLTIGDLPIVGAQTSDVVRGVVESLRPKQSFDIAAVTHGSFDMRALCYNLGACAAQGCSGGKVDLGDTRAKTRLWSPSWNAPGFTDLLVGPNVARTGREVVTLCRLAGASGVETLIFLADSLPGANANLLTGVDLGIYALKVFACVMERADKSGCAAHHLMAFYRGMTSSLSLHAHSDEGGYVRAPLKNATYPASVGVLTCTAGGYIGIPTDKNLVRSEITRVVMALKLTCAGLFSVAAQDDTGYFTVYDGNGAANQRPSTLSGLDAEFYDICEVWRRKMEVEFDLHIGTVADRHSARKYFTDDPVDRHIDGFKVMPFAYVEPSGLLVDSDEACIVASHGRVKMLPLVENGEVYFNPGTFEVGGRVVGGSSLYVKYKAKNLRGSAMSYIMSSEYNPANGLSQVEYEARPDLGTATTDALFVPVGVRNGAQRRWILPHCSIPNANEGATNVSLSFRYTYSGLRREPSKDDWVKSQYASFVDHLRIDTSPTNAAKTTHKDVPEYLELFVENQNRSNPLVDIGRITRYLPDVEVKPSDEPAPAPPIIEPDTLGEISSPEMADVEPPTDPEGPEAATEPSPDIGDRPQPPDHV